MQKKAEEIICRGQIKDSNSLYIQHIPATVSMCLCVRITRYVSLNEGSAALTGRMNQNACNTLCTGRLQRLITTQQQLENTLGLIKIHYYYNTTFIGEVNVICK